VNNDAAFESNGSGKSTILMALQQCLYNKTVSPTPIDDASRKSLANSNLVPYRIEVTFSDDVSEYTVINDRQTMDILIKKDGKSLLVRTIPDALNRIKQILNMDFNTFVTLTYISHDTIIPLIDHFTSSSLMKVILDFATISQFEKQAKSEIRVTTAEVVSIQDQIKTVKSSLEVLTAFDEVDISPFTQEKLRLTIEMKQLNDTALPSIDSLAERKANLTEEVINIDRSMSHISAKIDSSKCDYCDTLLQISEEELQDLKRSLELAEQQKELLDTKLLVVTEQLLTERSAYKKQCSEISTNIREVEDQITAAKTRNQLYKDAVRESDNLQSRLHELTMTLNSAEVREIILQEALSIIRDGTIQKDIMTTFVEVLNIHLKEYLTFVSLDYINISASVSRSSMVFTINDLRFFQPISIHSLSGGEKTRLRIVVLLAMLSTIKDLTQISTNLLIFDESLDTLDKSASRDLANLFEYMVKHDDKFIAMVSHGTQLSEIDFTGTIIATKTNGITTINKEVA
jgi:DNA repair exonuclease SbcCD ATPase subunit